MPLAVLIILGTLLTQKPEVYVLNDLKRMVTENFYISDGAFSEVMYQDVHLRRMEANSKYQILEFCIRKTCFFRIRWPRGFGSKQTTASYLCLALHNLNLCQPLIDID